MPLTLKKLRIIKLSIESCNLELLSRPNNNGYLIVRGLLYNVVGRYECAIKDFNKVIATDTQDCTGYFLRGDTFFKQGEIDNAKNDLLRGLKIQMEKTDPSMLEITEDKILELVVLEGEQTKRIGEVLDYEKNVILAQVLSALNWEDTLSKDDLNLLIKNN